VVTRIKSRIYNTYIKSGSTIGREGLFLRKAAKIAITEAWSPTAE